MRGSRCRRASRRLLVAGTGSSPSRSRCAVRPDPDTGELLGSVDLVKASVKVTIVRSGSRCIDISYPKGQCWLWGFQLQDCFSGKASLIEALEADAIVQLETVVQGAQTDGNEAGYRRGRTARGRRQDRCGGPGCIADLLRPEAEKQNVDCSPVPAEPFFSTAAGGFPAHGAGVVISVPRAPGPGGDPGDSGFTSAAANVLGFRLPTEPNTTGGKGGLLALWLGPDEWLVVTRTLRPRLRSLSKPRSTAPPT